MLTFKKFFKEEHNSKNSEPLEVVTGIDILSPHSTTPVKKKLTPLKENLLIEELSSNDKGVLHELLVGKSLNGGEHMSPEAKIKHDQIRQKMTDDEYDHHAKLAHSAATNIKKHVNGDIHSVHWSSKPGDIKKITGHNETQQENPSDIIIRHKNGSHTGFSLKVTSKKNGKVPVGNPGAGETDSQLGVNTLQHYHAARKNLEADHPELAGKKAAEQKQMIKSNPEMRASAERHSNAAIAKIRDTWHGVLSQMPTHKLADHLRNNLLHAKQTKVPMFKVTTGGSHDNHSVSIEHPHTHHDNILNDHQNITVEKSGNNSILFKHKGKVFLRHRLKPESTPAVTSLKGSAE